MTPLVSEVCVVCLSEPTHLVQDKSVIKKVIFVSDFHDQGVEIFYYMHLQSCS